VGLETYQYANNLSMTDEVNYSVLQYSTHCRTDRRNAGCQSIRLSRVELVPGT